MKLCGIDMDLLPPLPDASREVELATRIEAGLLAREALDGLVTWPDDATAEELGHLVGEGEGAWQEFYLANIRLVLRLSFDAHRRSGVPVEEFVQEGCVALAEALRRFDHTRGNRFSTICFPWVRNALVQVQMLRAGALDATPWRARQARALRQQHAAMESELGRLVPLSELAQRVGRSADWVGERLRVLEASAPLDAVGEAACPRAERRWAEAEQQAPGWVDRLGALEGRVLRLRYGLDDGVERTYDECARALGVSTSSVRRVERRALARAREVLDGLPEAA